MLAGGSASFPHLHTGLILPQKWTCKKNTNQLTIVYLKNLFYKSTLRILKTIMWRGSGGQNNPEKLLKWVKIQTSGIQCWARKKTFLKLHTSGFFVLYMVQYATFVNFCLCTLSITKLILLQIFHRIKFQFV